METRRILILYGTETGNSQDYAEIVAKICQRLRFTAVVKGMDDCTLGEIAEGEAPFIVFVCSTTGQGELPRNAHKLWRQLLRKRLPPTLFSGLRFSSFGLGDSSYPRFNWAIRKIHKRVSQLGAKEFATRGEGDEQHSEGTDAHFDSWLKNMAESLLELCPLPQGVDPIPEDELLPPRYSFEILKNKVKRASGEPKAVAMTRPDVSLGVVRENRRMTSEDHFQDVQFLSFDLEKKDADEPDIAYSPGDTVALYPSNNEQEVDLLIRHQGWSDVADYPVSVNEEFENAIPGGLVKPLTLRNLLIHHLDITAIPRRSFFATVWHFASGERERERLQEFSTLDGLQDLFDYANRPRRSILETITEFDTLRIPVEYVLDVLPILRSRLFSLASPEQTNHFELAIAIVKYKTILRRIRRGVCTRWVETLQNGDAIPFTVHKSSFAQNLDKPILMISPGTGVAPMRSLILTRNEKTDEKMLLFFGCRFASKDYLFEEDWKKVDSLDVVCAFSREGGGYVQNKLYAERETVGDLIVNQNASIYLCGSSGRMPREVRITIVAIIKEVAGLTTEGAEEYLKEMEVTGRYLQETWS
ncbi:NADPH-dependent diflavin oxidoreductase 1 [Trichomonascus vanleenenianus]|uniref:NAPDH-dependent diflavin reductase n=1 Tax=Trichomonascus vanleenenianus TaxID=2268995 RepID=UPI003EC95BA6